MIAYFDTSAFIPLLHAEPYAQVDRLDADDPWSDAPAISPRSSAFVYDAIHLAGAERLQDPELVLVAGDAPLLHAATEIGLAVART